MDYIEWVEKVLHAAVQARTHADELSHEYNGMNFRHIGGELGFGLEELESSAPDKPGMAVLHALNDLADLGLVEKKKMPGYFKLTREGKRAAEEGLSTRWGFLRSIRLDDDQWDALSRVVQNGEVDFGSYVGLREVELWSMERPSEGPYDGMRIFSLLKELDHDYQFIRDRSRGGVAKVLPTYQGIVWLTQTRIEYTYSEILKRVDQITEGFRLGKAMARVAKVNQAEPPAQPNKAEPPLKKPRTQVFISYSHRDKRWLDTLRTHLKPHIREGGLTVWDDTLIKPGAKWKDEIKEALATAKVAVLLVSPHFLASDFIAQDELPPLLKAAEEEGLTIVWIPVSHSAYRKTAIGQYQAANEPSKPLDSLKGAQRTKTLVEVSDFIVEAVQSQPSRKVRAEDNIVTIDVSRERTSQEEKLAQSPELSPMETRILQLIRDGHTSSQIADGLGITLGGIRYFERRIQQKLGARSTTEAIAKAEFYMLI